MSCPNTESFDHPACGSDCTVNGLGPRFERAVRCVPMGALGPMDGTASNCAPDAPVYSSRNEKLGITKDAVLTAFQCSDCSICAAGGSTPTSASKSTPPSAATPMPVTPTRNSLGPLGPLGCPSGFDKVQPGQGHSTDNYVTQTEYDKHTSWYKSRGYKIGGLDEIPKLGDGWGPGFAGKLQIGFLCSNPSCYKPATASDPPTCLA